jgi:hypothetical protein
MLMRALILAMATGSITAQSVDFRLKLVAGDTLSLDVTHSIEDSTIPTAPFTRTSTVQVRVVSSDDKGAVIDWQPAGTIVRSTATAEEMKVALAAKMVNDLHFKVALKPTGEFDRLLNGDDLAAPLLAARDTVWKALTPAELIGARPGTLENLTPDIVAEQVLKEIRLWAGFGGSAEVGRTQEVSVTRTTPFGGKSAPALCRVRLDSVTPELAALVRTTTWNEPALNALLAEEAQKAGMSLPPGYRIGMVETERYEIDRQLGLMRDVIDELVATTPLDTRRDRLAIRIVQAPKR